VSERACDEASGWTEEIKTRKNENKKRSDLTHREQSFGKKKGTRTSTTSVRLITPSKGFIAL
jgi:hypothetical protein